MTVEELEAVVREYGWHLIVLKRGIGPKERRFYTARKWYGPIKNYLSVYLGAESRITKLTARTVSSKLKNKLKEQEN